MIKFSPTHTCYINGIKSNIMFDKNGFHADNPENNGVPCSFHRIAKDSWPDGTMLVSSGNVYEYLKTN